MNHFSQRLTAAVAVLAFGVFTLIASVFPGLRDLDVKILELAQKDSISLPYSADSEDRHYATLKKGKALPFSNILITADEKKIFEEQPPSPIDLALILSSLRKSGHNKVTLAYPPSWEDIDPISLSLLEIEIQQLPASVIGFPLTRASRGDKMPKAMLASSIRIEDPGSLPVINRIPIQPATFGGKNSLIGFTRLENEDIAPEAPHLMAVWNDRIVFSTSILALALETKVSPHDFTYTPGQYLKLGPTGWNIPIDQFGRLSSQPNSQKITPSSLSAESLIVENSFTPNSPTAHISWHNSLLSTDLSLISLSPRATKPFTIKKLSLWHHLALFGALACVFFCSPTRGKTRILLKSALFILIISTVLLLGTYSLWLSPISLFMAWTGGAIYQPNTSSVSSSGY